jgi:flavin reductase (DIM6/NTAB) family NADH-FMN oxidoreductase RutF
MRTSALPVPAVAPVADGPAASSPVFRRALAQFATGVTVITTTTPDGVPVGMTVNSFASVSLEPPLVLWSLSRHAGSMPVFLTCERYLIHVLGYDQLDLARRFATKGADRFGPGGWQFDVHGLPRFDGVVAWLSCRNRSRHDEGDHVILVGEVAEFHVAGGAPLIFHDSRYVTHPTEAPLPTPLRSRWD